MKSYPEIYILGRMVNGVYVEYYPATFTSKSIAELSRGNLIISQVAMNYASSVGENKYIDGEWKILQYGRPRTVGE